MAGEKALENRDKKAENDTQTYGDVKQDETIQGQDVVERRGSTPL